MISSQDGIVSLVMLEIRYQTHDHHRPFAVVRMHQVGSKVATLLLPMVKWLERFVISGRETTADGTTALKWKIVEHFTSMSYKSHHYVGFVTAVSAAVKHKMYIVHKYLKCFKP